jgi:hypothetical protein
MTAGALPIMKMCQMGSKAAAVAAVEYEGKKAAVDVSACSWKIVRKWAGKVARAVEYGMVQCLATMVMIVTNARMVTDAMVIFG